VWQTGNSAAAVILVLSALSYALGEHPKTVYWGARYGVKTFLKRSPNWNLLSSTRVDSVVLERCVFQCTGEQIYLIADAYRGQNIEQAVLDYFASVSGDRAGDSLQVDKLRLALYSDAELTVYVGHDWLMDYRLGRSPTSRDGRSRQTAVLACMSRQYFGPHLKSCGAEPVLLTTGLMAPEAYVLDVALIAWVSKGAPSAVRDSAAAAYSRYQKCPLKAARGLFAHSY
jgi:hypothetical protein